MGSHESKLSTVVVSDQQELLNSNGRPFYVGEKKGKLKRAPDEQRDPPLPSLGNWIKDASSSFHQRPPPLARLSADDSSVSTTAHTELSSVSKEPQLHSIELSTLNILHVNRKVATETSQEFGSDSSAFKSYRPSGRRRRAFAIDSEYSGRRRLKKDRPCRLRPLPSKASYTSPHLLGRRTWLLREADRYEREGNLTGARPYLEECCRMDQAVIVNPLAAAHVYHKLGVLAWKIGAYHDSSRVLLKCLSLYDIHTEHPLDMHECLASAPLNEIQGLAVVLITLGRVHVSIGEMDPAVEYIRKSVAVVKHAMRSHPGILVELQPVFARSLLFMGVVYEARGRSNRALKTYLKCLQIQRTCLGACHVDVAATLNRIGGIRENLAAHAEAMVCYTEALRIYRSQLGLGCSPLDVAVTLNNTGFIHHKWRQYDRALHYYREALSIFSLLLGPCHRNITSTKYNIAQAYVAQGSSIRGLQLLKQVLRDQRVSLGGNHPDVAITLEAIATANQNIGRLSKACSYHEKALSIRTRRYGSRHVLVARTHDQLGQLHSECGRVDSARQCFREALIVYRFHHNLADKDVRIASMEKRLAHLDRRMNLSRPKRLFRRNLRRVGESEELAIVNEQPTGKDKKRFVL